ncbi:MAG: hypothetical protein FWG29_10355 [Treponema sp.]|nr:hypothetical protein [Treponema sp.]
MDVFGFVKNALQTGLNSLSGRVGQLLAKPKKPAFPLADRLLADAFRLEQIPSPTEQEKERASFVVERLSALNVPYVVDEDGNILASLHSLNETEISREPLLVFTRLVSERWNSLESLGKLELQYARGAGLADALGPAALLSVAETYAEGRLAPERDICLFFSAHHFDDPVADAFRIVTSGTRFRPVAAIGVRGFMLGFLTSHTLGSYRALLTVAEEEGQKAGANAVVNALVDITRHFQKAAEAFGSGLNLYFKRVEAQSSYHLTPAEGELELELESADGEILETALENIKAVAETTAYAAVKGSFKVIASIPPGDPELSKDLADKVLKEMKELKIDVAEEAKPDPASFLSAVGIPAVSVGIASGREGLSVDTVELASVEKGRLLLERIILQAGKMTGQDKTQN